PEAAAPDRGREDRRLRPLAATRRLDCRRVSRTRATAAVREPPGMAPLLLLSGPRPSATTGRATPPDRWPRTPGRLRWGAPPAPSDRASAPLAWGLRRRDPPDSSPPGREGHRGRGRRREPARRPGPSRAGRWQTAVRHRTSAHPAPDGRHPW